MIIYNYVFVGLLLFVAIGFSRWPRSCSSPLVAPWKPSLAKDGISTSAACGRTGETWIRFSEFNIIFTRLCLWFLTLRLIFLYPWAELHGSLGLFALVEMVIFLVILFIGFAYAWAKGVPQLRSEVG